MSVPSLTSYAQTLAQSFAEGNMVYAVAITRPAEPVFDPITGLLSESFAVVYAGKARITPLAAGAQSSSGDDLTFYSSTAVSIPIGAALPEVDDTVTITAHTDPAAIGRTFRVVDVELGGQMPVVRRLSCTGIQHARQGDFT